MSGAAVSFGGSVLTETLENLEEKAEELEELKEEFGRLVVVVGAGDLKRFINSCSEESSNAEKDIVGIKATRLNASVLRTHLEDTYPGIPKDFEELRQALETSETIVMGGTEPGHSTDAVAALAAEIIQADIFVKATNVDGVYDKDPAKEDAQKFKDISFEKLRELIDRTDNSPGAYDLMDMNACRLLERSGIKSVVVDGKSEGELRKIASGKHSGTVIS